MSDITLTIESIRVALGWATLINFGILIVWFAAFASAHHCVYRLHCRWFYLTPQRFDAIHYAAMVFFKLGIILLNLVPYLALRIIS